LPALVDISGNIFDATQGEMACPKKPVANWVAEGLYLDLKAPNA
jgi:hypothetical protein